MDMDEILEKHAFVQKTDEELISLVLGQSTGDSASGTAAFSLLVDRYKDKLGRYMWRLGVSQKQDIEDVLQEVFLKCYRNLRGFDITLSFSSWIYRIAHNEAVNFLRKNSRRPQGHYVYDAEATMQVIAHKDELAELVATKIEYEKVVEAMQGLKKKYKDVLVLRYLEGLEYKEISDVLKVPMGSVATLLYRAKKLLHKSLT